MTEFGEKLIRALGEAVAHAEGKRNIRGNSGLGCLTGCDAISS